MDISASISIPSHLSRDCLNSHFCLFLKALKFLILIVQCSEVGRMKAANLSELLQVLRQFYNYKVPGYTMKNACATECWV